MKTYLGGESQSSTGGKTEKRGRKVEEARGKTQEKEGKWGGKEEEARGKRGKEGMFYSSLQFISNFSW